MQNSQQLSSGLMEVPILEANPSSLLTDIAGRLKTFSVLKWCGMPYNVRFTLNLIHHTPD